MRKKLTRRVRPGVRDTRASPLRSARKLSSDDLPTLERPQNATSGSSGSTGGQSPGDAALRSKAASTMRIMRAAFTKLYMDAREPLRARVTLSGRISQGDDHEASETVEGAADRVGGGRRRRRRGDRARARSVARALEGARDAAGGRRARRGEGEPAAARGDPRRGGPRVRHRRGEPQPAAHGEG